MDGKAPASSFVLLLLFRPLLILWSFLGPCPVPELHGLTWSIPSCFQATPRSLSWVPPVGPYDVMLLPRNQWLHLCLGVHWYPLRVCLGQYCTTVISMNNEDNFRNKWSVPISLEILTLFRFEFYSASLLLSSCYIHSVVFLWVKTYSSRNNVSQLE